MTQFHSVKERVSLLLEVRRQIINPGTSHEVREALKVSRPTPHPLLPFLSLCASLPYSLLSLSHKECQGKALDKVEEVRTLMGQDITPRNAKGEIADEGNSGVVALYHLVPSHLHYLFLSLRPPLLNLSLFSFFVRANIRLFSTSNKKK